jgi:hypothetical protein
MAYFEQGPSHRCWTAVTLWCCNAVGKRGRTQVSDFQIKY